MNIQQLDQYDRFLDENDWDIYYWATQEPQEVEQDASSPAEESGSIVEDVPTENWKQGGGRTGEWAQTVGAFKPAYRPVPSRWADSQILALLRQHVQDKSAIGFHAAKQKKGSGLGRMPDVKVFDS